MARRKTVTTVEAVEPDEELLPPAGSTLDVDPDEQAEQDILDELKRLGGDDGVKWSVHKIATRPGERAGWCADYSTADLSLDAIRGSFGGGKYRVQGTKISGGQWVAKRTIEIMDLPGVTGTATPTPTPMGGIDVAALAQALRPAGDNGMLGLIMKMMESNTQQMTSLFNSLKSDKQSGPTAMELVTLIKALTPEKQDSIELLMRGLELGKSFAGGSGETGWMDLARDGIGIVRPLIEKQMRDGAATPALPRPAQPALAGPQPAIAPPVTPTPPGENVQALQQLNWLRAQLALLINQAAKHQATGGQRGDPELYADTVMDNLPPFITAEQLYERISAEDALTQLAGVDVRVNQFLPWFTQFRQAIIDMFEPETGASDAQGDNETIA